jgi:hypothetical protein
MRVCPKCGYHDIEQLRHSRFDFNADYMRFDKGWNIPELTDVMKCLKDAGNFVPYQDGPYFWYRRGTGGLWLYRVLIEDFKVPRERKNHKKVSMGFSNQRHLLECDK